MSGREEWLWVPGQMRLKPNDGKRVGKWNQFEVTSFRCANGKSPFVMPNIFGKPIIHSIWKSIKFHFGLNTNMPCREFMFIYEQRLA